MDEDKVILYVDDEFYNIKLFEMTFSKRYKVITTNSPLSALELLEKNNVKLAIIDYKMPGMNGMELITEIKKKYPHIICVILSAYLELEVITANDNLFRYLMKPWSKMHMLEVIEEAFSQTE
jgi:DNA-binding NtrC family response regulator